MPLWKSIVWERFEICESYLVTDECFYFHTDDDCEKRLQRLREVAAGVKNLDFSKYASSSRSCEADDEFDDDEERTAKSSANATVDCVREEDGENAK